MWYNEEDDVQTDEPELGVREPIKPKNPPSKDGIALEIPDEQLVLV